MKFTQIFAIRRKIKESAKSHRRTLALCFDAMVSHDHAAALRPRAMASSRDAIEL